MTKTRAKASETSIRNWFKEIQTYCEKMNCTDVLADPARVFNMDEIGFYLSPTNERVLARRGTGNFYNVISNNKIELMNMLLGANAKGLQSPPMVIFKGKTFPTIKRDGVPKSWGFGMFGIT